MVAEKSLQNLTKGKRLGHERPAKAGPGRPKKRQWVEDLEALAASPKERIAFLKRILHKKPEIAMHYLAGKPLEQIRIEANIYANVVQQTTIELAAAAASRILLGAPEKAPLSLPSEEIKVPVIES